eukprot:Opistho-2@91617
MGGQEDADPGEEYAPLVPDDVNIAHAEVRVDCAGGKGKGKSARGARNTSGSSFGDLGYSGGNGCGSNNSGRRSAFGRAAQWCGCADPALANTDNGSGLLSRLLRIDRKTAIALALGQILSLLITGTGLTSNLLTSRHSVYIPTAQSFLNYALLAAVYGTVLVRRGNLRSLFRAHWLKYAVLALIDVEANFLVVKAYEYTTFTSVQLLDCFAIPSVVVLSWLVLRVRYRPVHVAGICICLGGLGALVASDVKYNTADGSNSAKNPAVGDVLCLAGALLYGVSNVAQEFMVRRFDRVEYLAFLGAFATVISGVQMAIVERSNIADIDWSWEIALLLVGFALCLFFLYSLVPVLIVLSSATFLNLSLLTADFYTLLFGLFVFHLKFAALYFVGFALVVCGLIVYNAIPTPIQLEAAPGYDANAVLGTADEDECEGDAGEEARDGPLLVAADKSLTATAASAHLL